MGYTKEEILAKAQELAKMIAETEEVEYFKRVEEKINQNQKVQEKIDMIKKLQKHAVNLQNYGKFNALKNVEAKIEELEREVDEIPIVQEFKETQYDINQLLQAVTKTIANTVTDEIVNTEKEELANDTSKVKELRDKKRTIN